MGFYGGDCLKTCPVNCHHCNYESGKCLGGCRRGFSGHFCNSYERINLALHRPTFQLHTLFDGQPSSRLVDGKKSDLSIYNGQCTSTKNGQTFVMWRVDLEKLRRIERIVVYSRTDNRIWDGDNQFSKRLLGFSIIVSNTTNHKDGVICFHDQIYNKIQYHRWWIFSVPSLDAMLYITMRDYQESHTMQNIVNMLLLTSAK